MSRRFTTFDSISEPGRTDGRPGGSGDARLGVTLRHTQQLLATCRDCGAHGNCGREPGNKMETVVETEIQRLPGGEQLRPVHRSVIKTA